MSIELEIDKKPKKEIMKDIKVNNTNDIYELEEVQEIKDAKIFALKDVVW